MAPTAPDLEPADVLAQWIRRPGLHALAAALSASTLLWVVHGATTPGLTLLQAGWWPLGAALSCLVVVLGEGTADGAPPPVQWTEPDLARREIVVPTAARESDAVWSQAGATMWAGWLLGMSAMTAWWATSGVLTVERAVGVFMFTGALMVPAMWMVALLPAVLPALPRLWPRRVVVRVEGRQLVVGRRRFLLGDADLVARLEEVDGPEARLVLQDTRQRAVLTGAVAHVRAVYRVVVTADPAGREADVPASLPRARDGQGDGSNRSPVDGSTPSDR